MSTSNERRVIPTARRPGRAADPEPLPFARPEPWMRDALCAQVGHGDLWFPDKGGSVTAAKRICDECPVRAECLDYILDVERGTQSTQHRHGLWAGTTPEQRLRMEREAS